MTRKPSDGPSVHAPPSAEERASGARALRLAQDAGTELVEGAREKIAEMVRRIVEQFDPEKVILFGSHARGDAGPDSDVDLLVVMEVEGSKRERRVDIRCALTDIRSPKDIVVVTPEEVESYGDIVGTIIRPALREGEVAL